MTRNMDLIRRIALETSDLALGKVLRNIEGVEQDDFVRHVVWMEEAGLIKAHVVEFFDNSTPDAFVQRLTWSGCEFADAVRSDTLWRKAKESVIKPSASFSFGLLKDWLGHELREGFPTLR